VFVGYQTKIEIVLTCSCLSDTNLFILLSGELEQARKQEQVIKEEMEKCLGELSGIWSAFRHLRGFSKRSCYNQKPSQCYILRLFLDIV